MIDGSMHGWSRPNHMPRHLDALQTMAPVDLRRLAGDSHNVATEAWFETPCLRAPRRFWNDFGRFEEAKMDIEIDFGKSFFKRFFQLRFGIIFGPFFERPNLENSKQNNSFSMVFVYFYKINIFKQSSKKNGF